jgi:hypothetical protein
MRGRVQSDAGSINPRGLSVAHDVFISYSSKDKTTADAVCARLESRGARCWIAPRDVQPGAPYGEAIIDAIRRSRVMVLVLSANANTSKHIPKEIERAMSAGVTILPFRIEDVVPGKSLDLFIGSVHWLDALTPPLDRHLDRLAESVLKLLPDQGFQPPAPPPPPPRLDIFKIAVGAALILAVAMFGWFLLTRGNNASDSLGADMQTVPGGSSGTLAPTSALPPAGQAPNVGALAGTRQEIVGCWQWANNATIIIKPDGTMIAGPFTGLWRGGNRSYTFTWPEPVDTLAMSADGNRLTGGNQYGVPVTASRVSGGPGLPGVWKWGDVATVIIDPRGMASLATLSGSWALVDRNQRIYRVTWPRIQDTVTVSEDLTRIEGRNQYGVAVSGVRLPSCG